jgi:hypothetical protein
VDALKSFALSEKIFIGAEANKVHPIDLLSNKFTCETQQAIPNCYNYSFIFIFLLIAVEVFLIYAFVRYRKTISKKLLAGYSIVMQLLLIVPLAVLVISPNNVFNILSEQANNEVKTSIETLNNPTERVKVGVLSSTEIIAKKIATSSLDNFTIVESNPQRGAVLSFLKIPKQDKDTFYRAIVIPYQLDFQENQKGDALNSNLLYFPDKTLVINKVTKDDTESLLPVLANKMIITEFKHLVVTKNPPNTLFLNEIEYVVHQTREEEKLKKEFEDYIAYLYDYFEESDSIIQTNQSIVNSYPTDKQKYQREYEDYKAKWGNWYQECKSEIGNDPICEEGKTKIDSNIKSIEADLTSIDENKKVAEENLRLQIIYKNGALRDLTTAKQNYQDFLKNPITAEFQDGVFNPPDTIYVRFYEKDNKFLSSYLNTTLHEYLHFYSYSPDYSLDTFLDEGLTDYLTLAIASKYAEPEFLGVGYPNEIEVVGELVKHLPKEKIIQYYLDMNQTGFQRLFVEAYSPLDYENFILKGKNLFYASLKDNALREQYVKEIKDLLSRNKN